MKALVFSKGVSGFSEDGTEVTHVILVPDKSPSLSEMQKEYYKFHSKKLEQVSVKLEKIRKGAPRIGVPTKNNDGHYSQHFLNRFEELKRKEKFDLQSWIIKKYKGRLINFEE